MKSLLILLFAILAIASSCKKDPTATTAQPQSQPDSTDTTAVIVQKQRLSKIIKTGADITSQYTLGYNADGYLISYEIKTANNTNRDNWEQKALITFEYNAENLVTTEQFYTTSDGNLIGKYIYNSKNELEKINYTQDNVPDRYITYAWQDGKIIRVALKTGSDVIISDETIKYDNAGQVTEIESYNGATTPYIKYADIRYDDKINYINTIKGLQNYLNVSGVTPGGFCQHNMISCTYKAYSSSQATSDSYEYTYNADNYVIKKVKIGGTEVTELFYEKY